MTPSPKNIQSIKIIPASSAEPWVGVHTLTEFMFCPRAGIIASEQQQEEDVSSLKGTSSLPDYNTDSIEEALNRKLDELRELQFLEQQINQEKQTLEKNEKELIDNIIFNEKKYHFRKERLDKIFTIFFLLFVFLFVSWAVVFPVQAILVLLCLISIFICFLAYCAIFMVVAFVCVICAALVEMFSDPAVMIFGCTMLLILFGALFELHAEGIPVYETLTSIDFLGIVTELGLGLIKSTLAPIQTCILAIKSLFLWLFPQGQGFWEPNFSVYRFLFDNTVPTVITAIIGLIYFIVFFECLIAKYRPFNSSKAYLKFQNSFPEIREKKNQIERNLNDLSGKKNKLTIVIKTLAERRDLANKALAVEPDPETTHNEKVNWWSLLAANFVAKGCWDALSDEEIKLSGRPWKILIKGSLKIPVWRLRGKNSAEFVLREQHYARMAAYSHLVEKEMGGHSPYGIILFSEERYTGVTISNSQAYGRGSRIALNRGITRARKILRYAQDNLMHMPESQEKCLQCPFGRPIFFKRNSQENLISVNPVRSGEDGNYYHSKCGDRFSWIPPHQVAIDKELGKSFFDDEFQEEGLYDSFEDDLE